VVSGALAAEGNAGYVSPYQPHHQKAPQSLNHWGRSREEGGRGRGGRTRKKVKGVYKVHVITLMYIRTLQSIVYMQTWGYS